MKVGRNKFCAIDRLGSGEVVDGHMDGKGTYWHADSSRNVFFFFELSDLIVDRYEGSFCKSQRHGYGEYFFADGSCGAASPYLRVGEKGD